MEGSSGVQLGFAGSGLVRIGKDIIMADFKENRCSQCGRLFLHHKITLGSVTRAHEAVSINGAAKEHMVNSIYGDFCCYECASLFLMALHEIPGPGRPRRVYIEHEDGVKKEMCRNVQCENPVIINLPDLREYDYRDNVYHCTECQQQMELSRRNEDDPPF